MRARGWLLLTVMASYAAVAMGQQPGVGEAARTVQVAQGRLLRIAVADMETTVPPPARVGIRELKDALARLTDAVMSALPVESTAGAAQARLTSALPANKAVAVVPADGTAGDGPQSGSYGGELRARVTSSYAGVLLVEESFGIACGEDTVLLGYSNESGRWRRMLRWQAPAYDEVSGAFGDLFEMRVLKPQHEGNPVLLVVHGTPWCTSTVSGFDMDAFALDATRLTEKPFWHGQHGYRRADDVPPYAFSLKTTQDGFEVRASVSDWTDAIARVGVMRYRVTPASVERVLPIAMNARETVEEWLSMPRAEAVRFTDAAAGSLTWRMFDTFSYEGKAEGATTPSMVYGPVRACTDSPSHFQAEIESTVYSADNKTHAPGAPFYVQMRETGNGYTIHDTTATPSTACTGNAVKFGRGYGAQ